MAGVGEASAVLGLISSIIAIFEAAQEVYQALGDTRGLPKKFQTAADQIPLVFHALSLVERNVQAHNVSDEAILRVKPVLQACEERACKIKSIFDQNIPARHASRSERLLKALGLKVNSRKVKEAMEEIFRSLELLAQHQVFQDSETLRQIRAAVEKLNKISDQGEQLLALRSRTGESHARVANSVKAGNTHGEAINLPLELMRKPWDKGICLGQAPCISSELFVGRRKEMTQMKEMLKPGLSSGSRRLLAIGGMGGVGKTQLALAYAHLHRDHYDSVFWLDSTSKATMEASYQSLARHLFVASTAGALSAEHAINYVHHWLSDHQNTRWLLIFDNYDEPDQYRLQDYLPPASHGAVVITTRRPDRITGQKIRIMPLHVIEESLDILETRSERKNVKEDPHAKLLAQRLGGMPLALATAGVYLQASHLTFKDYYREYEMHWNVDTDEPLELPEYQNRTLYTTWSVSYHRLADERPVAAQLLKLLAYFDNQHIWYDLLRAGATASTAKWLQDMLVDEVHFANVMRVLTNYGFMELQQPTQAWSMHNCVHDWALGVLTASVNAELYCYAFDCVTATVDKDDWDRLGLVRYARVSRHAVHLTNSRFASCELSESLLTTRTDKAAWLAKLLSRNEQRSAAAQMYARAVAGYEKLLGPDDPQTLLTIAHFGRDRLYQGQFDRAEQLLSRALAGFEKTLGPDHHMTLFGVAQLANFYCVKGELDRADQMYTRALSGFVHTAESDYYPKSYMVVGLALLRVDQGRLAEAEEIFIRAMASRGEDTCSEHELTLSSMKLLGDVYRAQDKLDRAEEMYTQVLAGQQKSSGHGHWVASSAMISLGGLYDRQGKLAEAEQIYTRALAGQQEIFGHEHQSTLSVLTFLGRIYRLQGKLDEAEQFYMRALAGKEKVLGSDHESTLYTMLCLGDLYLDQGEPAKAERIRLRVLARKEKTHGLDGPSTLSTVYDLALFYHSQHKLDEAVRMYERALAINEKSEPGHPLTITIVQLMSSLYRDQGKLYEAEQVYVRALAVRETTLLPGHSSIISMVDGLGRLYQDQNKLSEAEQVYARMLKSSEKALGPDHSWILDTANLLGLIYREQNRPEEAAQMYRRVLSAQQHKETEPHFKIAVEGLAATFNIATHKQDLDGRTRRATLAQFIQYAQQWLTTNIAVVKWLVKALLYVGEVVHTVLIGCALLEDENDVLLSFGILCDGCDDEISSSTGCHMCSQCEDVDLCDACMTKYTNDHLEITTCRGTCYRHRYYNAGMAVTQALQIPECERKNEIKAHLDQLWEKYKVYAIQRSEEADTCGTLT